MQEFEQLASDIKKKKYAPVYFLMGEEPYFIDTLADLVEKTVLDDSEKEFNQTIVYGKDTDILSIISAAKRFPMMSEKQVVIVKEAQNLKDLIGREKADDNKIKHPFATYLENPQPSTILLFCYKYKTLDKRTALAKQIAKNAVLFESKKLYDNKIPDWIEQYLKSKQFSIDPRAAAMLTEYLGNDLSKIANELDKLMINLPAKSEISIDHIQNNIGISKEYNTFELQKALGKRDILKANRIVNYFASNEKDNPLVVTISTLYGFFSKLIIYHVLPDKSKMAVAAGLGINPFFVQEYEQAARVYPIQKLRMIVNYLREYDLKSKGVDAGNISQGELLKELVFKILH